MDVAEGDAVELDKVLLVADEDKITVGTPTVDGARVLATSQGGGKDKKIIVFHYKPKVRYRKKTGHRRQFTRLTIDEIIKDGSASLKKVRQTKKEADEFQTKDAAD